MSSAQEEKIAKAYYDPKTGYQSASKLKNKLPGVPLKAIQEFIKNQSTSQQFHTRRQKYYFPITRGADVPFSRIQIDLVDMDNYGAKYNHGMKWILIAIDVYSRYDSCALRGKIRR